MDTLRFEISARQVGLPTWKGITTAEESPLLHVSSRQGEENFVD
jgi:hypothetical protein